MNKDRYEIRFGGSGGQGIITAAVILAEAASIYGSYHVCQTQSYGPQSRGGRSKAEIIISENEIDYPHVIKMDCFLAMNQPSLDAYFSDFEPNGLLVVDATFVEQVPTSRAIALPFTRMAREDFGKEIVANIIALGAVGQLTAKIPLNSLEQAVLARVPAKFRELNQKALQAGIAAAAQIDLNALPGSVVTEEILI